MQNDLALDVEGELTEADFASFDLGELEVMEVPGGVALPELGASSGDFFCCSSSSSSSCC